MLPNAFITTAKLLLLTLFSLACTLSGYRWTETAQARNARRQPNWGALKQVKRAKTELLAHERSNASAESISIALEARVPAKKRELSRTITGGNSGFAPIPTDLIVLTRFVERGASQAAPGRPQVRTSQLWQRVEQRVHTNQTVIHRRQRCPPRMIPSDAPSRTSQRQNIGSIQHARPAPAPVGMRRREAGKQSSTNVTTPHRSNLSNTVVGWPQPTSDSEQHWPSKPGGASITGSKGGEGNRLVATATAASRCTTTFTGSWQTFPSDCG